jgi:hypothetical protein
MPKTELPWRKSEARNPKARRLQRVLPMRDPDFGFQTDQTESLMASLKRHDATDYPKE